MIGMKGKIKRLQAKHFLTHEQISFNPSSHFNVIFGSNGAGKSALMTAVIIGLGGTGAHKIAARSSDLGAFVQNEKDKSEITIELFNTDAGDKNDVTTFYKSFNNKGGELTWHVDRRKVTEKTYMERVHAFNVHVDNLCSFLPQDRFLDFAKLKEQERLVACLKETCSPEVLTVFESLKNQQKEAEDVYDLIIKTKSEIDTHENKLKILEPQLQNLQFREEKEEELKICKMKKAFLEYEDCKKKVNELDPKCKKIKSQYDNAQKTLQEHKTKEAEFLKKQTELKRIVNKDDELFRSSTNAFSGLTEKFESMQRRARQIKMDFNEKEKSTKNSLKMLDTSTSKLSDTRNMAQQKLLEYGSKEQRTEEVAKLNELISVHRNEKQKAAARLQKINDEIFSMKPRIDHLENKIANVANVEEQKRMTLQNNFPDVYKAVEVLRGNIENFSGKIYNPMIIELSVKDPKRAIYAENCVAQRDWLAFGCERKEDVQPLMNLMSQHGLTMSVFHSDSADRVLYSPDISMERLRQYGFDSYVLDWLTGPAPLLNYLCSINQIHNIPVGNDQVEEQSMNVPSEIGLFFSTQTRFSVTKSRYGGAKSSASSTIRPRNWLHSDKGDDSGLRKLRDDLVRKRDNLRNERVPFDNKITELDAEVLRLSQQKSKIEKQSLEMVELQRVLTSQKNRIEQIQKDMCNIDDAKNKMNSDITTNLKDQLRLVKDQSKLWCKNKAAYINWQTSLQKLTLFSSRNADALNAMVEAESQVEDSRSNYNSILAKYNELKKKSDSLFNVATQLIGENVPFPGTRNFPHRQAFTEQPDSVEDLGIKIGDLIGAIQCMCEVDNDIGEQVRVLEEKIEASKRRLEELGDRQSSLGSTMQHGHKKWFKEVSNCIDKINRKFSEYMAEMEFCGEVLIAFKKQLDYSTYGLQIRVKYRENEAMQVLDNYRQSGGERTLAIAIFLLAMQSSSLVPIRFADELNQGVDPTNERKLFDLFVKRVAKPGVSQYCFITPKFLSNLPHSRHMSFHCLFNTPSAIKFYPGF